MNHDALFEFVVEECSDDAMGLWTLLAEVRKRYPAASEQDCREAALGVIADVLRAGDIVAGEFERRGDKYEFMTWALPNAGAVERIRAAWIALGRDPKPGDVVWFASRPLLPLSMAAPPPQERRC